MMPGDVDGDDHEDEDHQRRRRHPEGYDHTCGHPPDVPHFAFFRFVTSGHFSPSIQVLQVSHQKRPEHRSRLLNSGGCQEWECGKIACPPCSSI